MLIFYRQNFWKKDEKGKKKREKVNEKTNLRIDVFHINKKKLFRIIFQRKNFLLTGNPTKNQLRIHQKEIIFFLKSD